MATVWTGTKRKSRRPRTVTVLSFVALVLLAGLAALWWVAGWWTPPRDRYPVQGIAISAANGEIDWLSLRAVDDVDFVYLHATAGSYTRDPAFTANWNAARAAGLRYGAIHDFSLCRLASDQARLFIATVPRDNAALPAVVSLSPDDGCASHPGRDVVLSELNTFLNEIEAHSGKPAILRISRAFERQFNISAGINRTVWLDQEVLPPAYASHPWVMWTANSWRRVRGVPGRADWTVVLP
jgi:lysozyme